MGIAGVLLAGAPDRVRVLVWDGLISFVCSLIIRNYRVDLPPANDISNIQTTNIEIDRVVRVPWTQPRPNIPSIVISPAPRVPTSKTSKVNLLPYTINIDTIIKLWW
jgi:hypothetical protein